MIVEQGADTLRFALVNGLAAGADQRLGESRLDGARNFGNKLWNAARFVVGSRPAEIAAAAPLEMPQINELGPADEWIMDRCARTIADVDRAYDEFQYGEVGRLLYDAIWSEYCDWYLEMAKTNLAPEATPSARVTTWRTLAWVLDRYLRLLHPLMPFVTEAIWERVSHAADDPDLLIVAPWPSAPAAQDSPVATGVASLIELTTAIRAARAEAAIEPGDWLSASIWLPDGPARAVYKPLAPVVGRLARIRATLVGDRSELESDAATVAIVSAHGEARLLRSDADRARERARLEKELRTIETQLQATQARLADQAFTGRAPADVVAQTRRRALELADHAASLTTRLEET